MDSYIMIAWVCCGYLIAFGRWMVDVCRVLALVGASIYMANNESGPLLLASQQANALLQLRFSRLLHYMNQVDCAFVLECR
jgi:hypothetical protein